jgi:hypothetical protein
MNSNLQTFMDQGILMIRGSTYRGGGGSENEKKGSFLKTNLSYTADTDGAANVFVVELPAYLAS